MFTIHKIMSLITFRQKGCTNEDVLNEEAGI